MLISRRNRAVEDVVFVRGVLAESVAVLRLFPWDCEEELVVLGTGEVRRCVAMCIDGRLSASDLELWADTLEARDDVSFEPRAVIDLIAEISTPELYGELTSERCRALLGEIDRIEREK